MSARVAVSQSVLSWALQRSGRTFEKALTKFPKLGDWMDGSGQPTLHDLEKFAAYTHTSLGALIMPEPPDEALPIADMRTRESGSSPVEWCNRFVSFGLGYALSWSGVSSCWVGCGVSRDLVRMSRLR